MPQITKDGHTHSNKTYSRISVQVCMYISGHYIVLGD